MTGSVTWDLALTLAARIGVYIFGDMQEQCLSAGTSGVYRALICYKPDLCGCSRLNAGTLALDCVLTHCNPNSRDCNSMSRVL